MTTKEIKITVELDDDQVPGKIAWEADDSGKKEKIENCRAMILSMWDHTRKDTLRLDLWTRDMTQDEMKIFFYETLRSMADTLEKSVSDERIAGDMKDFCEYFAKKMEIVTQKPR
ncbi:MAG: gliding motility protein GldC [Balneolales bacterium]